MNKKLMAMVFAAVIFACVLSVNIVALAGEPKVVKEANTQKQTAYTEYPGEIGDIARRAEENVKEVNDSFLLEKEKLDTVKREQYFEDYKEETAKSLLSAEDIAALEKERARNENAIRTQAGYGIKSLEAEQTARQKASSAAPGPRTFSQTSSRWMVKGVVFYENKGAALIAGEVVRENDVVMGVKVVRILPDYVEFEKQGNQWKQQVGQMPPPAVWEQPQQSSPNQRSSTDTNSKDQSGR